MPVSIKQHVFLILNVRSTRTDFQNGIKVTQIINRVLILMWFMKFHESQQKKNSVYKLRYLCYLTNFPLLYSRKKGWTANLSYEFQNQACYLKENSKESVEEQHCEQMCEKQEFVSLLPKIQQTKMLVTCQTQRFVDLFLFGLGWQYFSVQTKYNKSRFKVMATYLQQ